MYCAAYAMTQPEQRICIFSPSRRQSKMLLDQIKKFIHEYEGGADRIKKFNQEEVSVWARVRASPARDTRPRARSCGSSGTIRTTSASSAPTQARYQ